MNHNSFSVQEELIIPSSQGKSIQSALESDLLALRREQEELNHSYNATRIELKSYWMKMSIVFDKIKDLDSTREKLIKQCIMSSCPIEHDDNEFFQQYKSTYYPSIPSSSGPDSPPRMTNRTLPLSPTPASSNSYELVDSRTRSRLETARLLRVQLARQQELMNIKKEIENRLEAGRRKISDHSMGLKGKPFVPLFTPSLSFLRFVYFLINFFLCD